MHGYYFKYKDINSFEEYDLFQKYVSEKENSRSAFKIFFDVTDNVKKKPELFTRAMEELAKFIELFIYNVSDKYTKITKMVICYVNGFEQIASYQMKKHYTEDLNSLKSSYVFSFIKKLGCEYDKSDVINYIKEKREV